MSYPYTETQVALFEKYPGMFVSLGFGNNITPITYTDHLGNVCLDYIILTEPSPQAKFFQKQALIRMNQKRKKKK